MEIRRLRASDASAAGHVPGDSAFGDVLPSGTQVADVFENIVAPFLPICSAIFDIFTFPSD